MLISSSALKSLIQESLRGDRIIRERPWSVEFGFTLSGGVATDSEGRGPDGIVIAAMGESGKRMNVVIDTYWNPHAGDKSGNSIKINVNENPVPGGETYVPTRMDDGNEQRLVISNSPVANAMTISHSHDGESPPVVYLVVPNPFAIDEDIKFTAKKLGNGKASIRLLRHINL